MTKTLTVAALVIAALALTACGRRSDMDALKPVTDAPKAEEAAPAPAPVPAQ
jgi:PBP1b-binding outer membrane lipoprotein LpoB